MLTKSFSRKKNEKCELPKFVQFCGGLDKGLYGKTQMAVLVTQTLASVII